MQDALPHGATIGILGGGQLGRMLSVAASRLGYKTCVFEPMGDCPASHVANYHFKASYEDIGALQSFAEACQVITYEFENIPANALDTLSALRPIRPGASALAVSQDRLFEKAFLTDLGLQTAPFADVPDLSRLEEALARFGTPAILKTRRLGYDGKGQVKIDRPEQAADALTEMRGAAGCASGTP
ncbi:MAG: ATP-grasp domain-containing protein, partial [Pseudomonadota bacterium]